MQTLNLPSYPLKIINRSGKPHVFDVFRKRYVKLTPEEWVRQNFLWWMRNEKEYPASLIAVEASLTYNRMVRRADAIVYGRSAFPLMIIECKAPAVKITGDVFDQIARYNFSFGVEYLVVTNGMEHYCCRKDAGSQGWTFLESVPAYAQLVSSCRCHD